MKFNSSSSEPKIAEGQYDALLMGIISLGLQPGNPNAQYPSGQRPAYKLKLIFEIPEQKNDDGTTVMQAVNLAASLHEKGNLHKYINALLRKPVSGDALATAVEDGSLLGKPIVLTIAHWQNDKGYTNIKIGDVTPLHQKIEPPAATRDTLFFDPTKPDIKVFEALTYYTQKAIMNSLDAEGYDKEMHAIFAQSSEDSAIKQADKKEVVAKNATVADGDLGAIQ